MGNQNCNLLKKLIIYDVNDLTINSSGQIREPKITPFFISLISPIFKIMLGDSQHQTYLKKKPKQNEKERDPTTIEHPPSHQQQESTNPMRSQPHQL